jgi:hypothetical protein
MVPAWAMRAATAVDRVLVQHAQRQGWLQIQWPEGKAVKQWAKVQGWPVPWFGFDDAFIGKMLESDETFALALTESGVALQIPRSSYTLSTKQVQQLDALYTERSASGRPVSWGTLVEELREIRRAVEAEVKIHIEGADTVLVSWQDFYTWAHGRFHMLEDGYDSWIGDDR